METAKERRKALRETLKRIKLARIKKKKESEKEESKKDESKDEESKKDESKDEESKKEESKKKELKKRKTSKSRFFRKRKPMCFQEFVFQKNKKLENRRKGIKDLTKKDLKKKKKDFKKKKKGKGKYSSTSSDESYIHDPTAWWLSDDNSDSFETSFSEETEYEEYEWDYESEDCENKDDEREVAAKKGKRSATEPEPSIKKEEIEHEDEEEVAVKQEEWPATEPGPPIKKVKVEYEDEEKVAVEKEGKPATEPLTSIEVIEIQDSDDDSFQNDAQVMKGKPTTEPGTSIEVIEIEDSDDDSFQNVEVVEASETDVLANTNSGGEFVPSKASDDQDLESSDREDSESSHREDSESFDPEDLESSDGEDSEPFDPEDPESSGYEELKYFYDQYVVSSEDTSPTSTSVSSCSSPPIISSTSESYESCEDLRGDSEKCYSSESDGSLCINYKNHLSKTSPSRCDDNNFDGRNDIPSTSKESTNVQFTDEEKSAVKKPKLSEAERDEMNKRTIFITNVRAGTEMSRINREFKKFGPIEHVKFRFADSISKKYLTLEIFLTYKYLDSVEQALSMDGTTLRRLPLKVERMKPKIKVKNNDFSVFVGNLSFDVDEDVLLEAFKNCGDIESVKIIKYRTTRRERRIGFINFENDYGVLMALEMNESWLKDRPLCVKLNTPHARKEKRIAKARKRQEREDAKKDSPRTRKQKYMMRWL